MWSYFLSFLIRAATFALLGLYAFIYIHLFIPIFNKNIAGIKKFIPAGNFS